LKYSQPHFENWRLIEVQELQEQFWNRASVLLCLPELQILIHGSQTPCQPVFYVSSYSRIQDQHNLGLKYHNRFLKLFSWMFIEEVFKQIRWLFEELQM
jgi:hypothetical protein